MSQCKHEWVVFSCTITEGYIVVQCWKCDTVGAIEDPTKEEWADAGNETKKPYYWADNDRVSKQKPCSYRYVEKIA